MSDENVVDDLEQILSNAAQEPPVKGIIDRLNDNDVEVLKHWTDATYAKRLEPRQASERQNQEYRQRVSTMSNIDFEREKAKLVP
jgi:hypothetical protein